MSDCRPAILCTKVFIRIYDENRHVHNGKHLRVVVYFLLNLLPDASKLFQEGRTNKYSEPDTDQRHWGIGRVITRTVRCNMGIGISHSAWPILVPAEGCAVEMSVMLSGIFYWILHLLLCTGQLQQSWSGS